MKADKDTLEKISGLAGIEIRPEEQDNYLRDLNKILEMMDDLNEVDTGSIEAFSHFPYQKNNLRDDTGQNVNFKKAALDNAPHSDNDYFIVPKVIKDK